MFRSQDFEIFDEPLDADGRQPSEWPRPSGQTADVQLDDSPADPGAGSDSPSGPASRAPAMRWLGRGLTVCALVGVVVAAAGLVRELGRDTGPPDAAQRARPERAAPTVALPQVRDRRRPLTRRPGPQPRTRQRAPRRRAGKLPARPAGLAFPSTQAPAPKRLPRRVLPRPPVKPAVPVSLSPEFL